MRAKGVVPSDQILDSALRAHLGERMHTGEMYSVPCSLARVLGLADVITTPMVESRPSAPPAIRTPRTSDTACTDIVVAAPKRRRVLTLDDEHPHSGLHERDAAEHGDAQQPRLYFKLVSTDALRGKHIKGAPATSSWFDAKDIAVTFHEGYEDCEGGAFRNVRALRPDGSNHSVAILRFDTVDMSVVAENLACHSLSQNLMLRLEDAPPKLLEDMTLAGAWEGSGRQYEATSADESSLAALTRLADARFATCTAKDSACSTWQLTNLARAVVHNARARTPAVVLHSAHGPLGGWEVGAHVGVGVDACFGGCRLDKA